MQHILFCILNWGLGHATRSKVIIDELLLRGHRLSIASDGASLNWLKKEYPNLNFLELPAYNIQYSKGGNLNLKMLQQLLKINKAIQKEHSELKALCKRYDFDAVISDNRLGCYWNKIPCVYITHQLSIRAGIFSRGASFMHKRFINRFDYCWIPDSYGSRLSGELSTGRLKIPKTFIGSLSRLEKQNQKSRNLWVIVLSGPEPQKSILEKKLLKQVKGFNHKFVVIGGSGKFSLPDNVEYYTNLNSKRLNEILNQAKLVISRSGYSSLMDYAKLELKALLIPTPGQGEQEYLAALHHQSGSFYAVSQKELNLSQDLEKALTYSGFSSKEPDQTNWKETLSLFEGKGKGRA